MESSSTEKEIMETNNIEEKSDVKTTDNVDIKKLPLPFGQTTMGYAPPMIFKTTDILDLTEEEEEEIDEFFRFVYGFYPTINTPKILIKMMLEDCKACKKNEQSKNLNPFPTTPELFEIEMSETTEKKTNLEEDRKRLSDEDTIDDVKNKQQEEFPKIPNKYPLDKFYQMRIDEYFATHK